MGNVIPCDRCCTCSVAINANDILYVRRTDGAGMYAVGCGSATNRIVTDCCGTRHRSFINAINIGSSCRVGIGGSDGTDVIILTINRSGTGDVNTVHIGGRISVGYCN